MEKLIASPRQRVAAKRILSFMRKAALEKGLTKMKALSSSANMGGKWNLTTSRKQAIKQLSAAVRSNRSLYGKPIESVMSLFIAMDKSNSGFLSQNDFKNALKRLGLGLSSDQIKDLADVLDVHKLDRIEFEDFGKLLSLVDTGNQEVKDVYPTTSSGRGMDRRKTTSDLTEKASRTPSPSRPSAPSPLRSRAITPPPPANRRLPSAYPYHNAEEDHNAELKSADYATMDYLDEINDPLSRLSSSKGSIDKPLSVSALRTSDRGISTATSAASEATSRQLASLGARGVRTSTELSNVVKATIAKLNLNKQDKIRLTSLLDQNIFVTREIETVAKVRSQMRCC
jgi:hypothetical protein